MSLSSFRVHQDATGQLNSAWTEKIDKHPAPRGRGSIKVDIVPRAPRRDRTVELCLDEKGYENPPSRVRGRMSLSSFRVQQDTTDSRVVPRRKKGDEHPPPSGYGRMSLSSFRVHQDATGQQSSASTEKGDEHPLRRAAVGCRCHRSACTKMRPDSRVVPRRKKGYEHPPPRVRGRNSLSSFRVQQDTNGQQSIASTEKSDEHPPRRGFGRMSLSSFRVHQDATGQQSSSSTER
ncbi:hypothetical protein TNCV_4587891 [Trichonephila clavipes]|uniref:Uncharacterized protein n=1 Tax=Trichonephila clavipes TaxID=2585209 RepID=A0A8X6VCT5_TRICX|nr:hypothetical protein TNCV_4587891 [Trichonephila clavipes]